jgi:Aspartyl protease
VGFSVASETTQEGGFMVRTYTPKACVGVLGVTVSNITIGDIELDHVSAVEGTRVDGLMGGELFSKYVVRIDYMRSSVDVFPASYEYHGDGTILPLTIDGLVFTDASVLAPDGHYVRGTFIVDTGVRLALLLNGPFVDKNHLLDGQRRVPHATVGVGVGGETRGDVFRVSEFALEGLHMSDVMAVASRDNVVVDPNDGLAGIIGGDFLRRFRLTLDYPHHRMVLEETPETRAPFNYDRSGMFLLAEGDDFRTIRVHRVIAGSTAESRRCARRRPAGFDRRTHGAAPRAGGIAAPPARGQHTLSPEARTRGRCGGNPTRHKRPAGDESGDGGVERRLKSPPTHTAAHRTSRRFPAKFPTFLAAVRLQRKNGAYSNVRQVPLSGGPLRSRSRSVPRRSTVAGDDDGFAAQQLSGLRIHQVEGHVKSVLDRRGLHGVTTTATAFRIRQELCAKVRRKRGDCDFGSLQRVGDRDVGETQGPQDRKSLIDVLLEIWRAGSEDPCAGPVPSANRHCGYSRQKQLLGGRPIHCRSAAGRESNSQATTARRRDCPRQPPARNAQLFSARRQTATRLQRTSRSRCLQRSTASRDHNRQGARHHKKSTHPERSGRVLFLSRSSGS